MFLDRAHHYRRSGDGPANGWWMLAVRIPSNEASGVESAEMTSGGVWERPFDRSTHTVADGADAAEAALLDALLAYGLNPSEAAGLLDTWREAFFHKPGTRVLSIMPGKTYDAFCPLIVGPKPTERARVGIVVTELGEKAK
jgi:hypothetical protein